MAAPGMPVRRIATLLMESHGLAPSVRSTSFASIATWSKLYQTGPYIVELNLRPDEGGVRLYGEILTQDDTAVPRDGTVTLHDQRSGVVPSAPLLADVFDADAGFSFGIDHVAHYRLEVAFAQEVLIIADIEVR